MQHAINISTRGLGLTCPNPSVGCVIVKDEKIIAEGSNKVTFSNDPTAHAEIVAIREACKKLNISFTSKMLQWPSGPKEGEGVWGEYWYQNVW